MQRADSPISNLPIFPDLMEHMITYLACMRERNSKDILLKNNNKFNNFKKGDQLNSWRNGVEKEKRSRRRIMCRPLRTLAKNRSGDLWGPSVRFRRSQWRSILDRSGFMGVVLSIAQILYDAYHYATSPIRLITTWKIMIGWYNKHYRMVARSRLPWPKINFVKKYEVLETWWRVDRRRHSRGNLWGTLYLVGSFCFFGYEKCFHACCRRFDQRIKCGHVAWTDDRKVRFSRQHTTFPPIRRVWWGRNSDVILEGMFAV